MRLVRLANLVKLGICLLAALRCSSATGASADGGLDLAAKSSAAGAEGTPDDGARNTFETAPEAVLTKDYTIANRSLRNAAEQGNALAQYLLGVRCAQLSTISP